MDDDLFLPEDDTGTPAACASAVQVRPWVLAIVDDDPGVHDVTRLVLRGFRFDGQPLEILHAYSGAEGRALFSGRDDIAVALLDVVMENDHAGLDLVRHIRETLDNRLTRIVLRTGQPGQAPEEQVIRTYDINDYKEKTELTRTKLHTLLYSSLRSYRDIRTIADSVKGLESVIDAVRNISEAGSLRVFASALLNETLHLIGLQQPAVCVTETRAFSVHHSLRGRSVLAATGGLQHDAALPQAFEQEIAQAIASRCSGHTADKYVGYYRTHRGNDAVLVVACPRPLHASERHLLDFFAMSVAITHESLLIRDELAASQQHLAALLGDAIELRDGHSLGHARRVGALAAALARAAGLDEDFAQKIGLAAPLHDAGKLTVDPGMLASHRPLAECEQVLMQAHASNGARMLGGSGHDTLELAATIAAQHHERWDGSGYPRGLAGEDIHMAARIVGIADVFDSVTHARPYGEVWTEAQALDYIQTEAGSRFDPALAACFIAHAPQILAAAGEAMPGPAPHA